MIKVSEFTSDNVVRRRRLCAVGADASISPTKCNEALIAPYI